MVTPPVRPPALFERWIQRPPSPRPSMTSWTCDPNRRVCSKPSPNSTPLTMLMLITAAARAASSRRSQWTYDPSPIGSPWATTSNTPPTVSPFERASSIRAIIRVSASGSGQRSGEASAASRGRLAASGSTATPPTSAVNDQTSTPSSARNARATPPAATRAAVSRADARSSTLRTSLKPYFTAPARSAWPGRTRVTGVARLLPPSARASQLGRLVVAERLDLHDPRPVLPVAVGDLEQDRRAEGQPVADPRHDLGAVLLDGLAGAPAVAALTAGQVERDRVGGQGQAGRDPLDDDPQRPPVRFPGGQEAEPAHASPWPRRRSARPRPTRCPRPGPPGAWPASARAGPAGRSTG